jgi:hypothetical protein
MTRWFVPVAGMALVSLPACRCERAEDEELAPVPRPTASAVSSAEESPLLATLRGARRSGKAAYVAPSRAELEVHERWIGAVAKAGWTDQLPTSEPPEGFSGRLTDDGALWLLQEKPTRKRGAGLLVLRPGSGRRIVVEAPHTFFDQRTLEIATLVFQGTRARALLINTMHRYGAVPEDRRGDGAARKESPSDVAHEADTLFGAAHRALIAAEPGVTLQLHGFADETAPGVMAVVSAARTGADVQGVARALRDALGDDRVRVYPDEIDVLGGTSNAQAKVSRAHGVPFVHLELSNALRRSLLDDPALADRFVSALRVLGEAAP